MMNILNSSQYNISNNPNCNLKFKGRSESVMQSVNTLVSNRNVVSDSLVRLQKKYFHSLSTIDKILIKLNLKKDLSGNMAILDHIGTNPWLHKGEISIKSYGQEEQIKLAKMGFDENKVLDKVTNIRMSGDFRHSSLKDLKDIEVVGKNLYLNESQITDLKKLKRVDRHIYMNEHFCEDDFANVSVGGCILR